jgi:hypothetical protein
MYELVGLLRDYFFLAAGFAAGFAFEADLAAGFALDFFVAIDITPEIVLLRLSKRTSETHSTPCGNRAFPPGAILSRLLQGNYASP